MLISVMSGFHGDSEIVSIGTQSRRAEAGATTDALPASDSGSTGHHIHRSFAHHSTAPSYLSSAEERAAFAAAHRSLTINSMTPDPDYVLPLRQSGDLSWAVVANCSLTISSVGACVTITAPLLDIASTVHASGVKYFSIPVPAMTEVYVIASSGGNGTVLKVNGLLDAVPSDATADQSFFAKVTPFGACGVDVHVARGHGQFALLHLYLLCCPG